MKVVIQQQLKKQQAEYGSKLYQSVAYTHHLHITLIHAQNIKATNDRYFIVIEFMMVEIFAFLQSDAL